MTKIVGMMSLFISVIGVATAGGPIATPEIDPASGVSALALLSGALLVIRHRKK
jgi:hypothetical protein